MAGSDATILFGGESSERRVSVASGQHVSAVLDEARTFFLAPSGAVYDVERKDLQQFEKPFERDFVPRGEAAFEDLVAAVESAPQRVWMLALHGGEGEDGTVQRMLETRKIAFSGPGAVASSRAFDKEIAKQVATAAGVRIAQSVHFSADPRVMRELLRDFLSLHKRIVAKPVAGGSSVGLYHLNGEADVETAARGIERSGETYLAEQCIAG